MRNGWFAPLSTAHSREHKDPKAAFVQMHSEMKVIGGIC